MKRFCVMILACTVGLDWAETAQTATGGEGGRFVVAPVAEARPEYAPQVLIVLTEVHRFAVTVPRGWGAKFNDSSRELSIQKPGVDALLTVTFRKNRISREDVGQRFWTELQERFDGAERVDRPELMAFSRPAVGFDMSWSQASGVGRMGRFALVEVDGVPIEFGLVTSPERFQNHLATLMHFMASIRIGGADERIEVPYFGIE